MRRISKNLFAHYNFDRNTNNKFAFDFPHKHLQTWNCFTTRSTETNKLLHNQVDRNQQTWYKLQAWNIKLLTTHRNLYCKSCLLSWARFAQKVKYKNYFEFDNSKFKFYFSESENLSNSKELRSQQELRWHGWLSHQTWKTDTGMIWLSIKIWILRV